MDKNLLRVRRWEDKKKMLESLPADYEHKLWFGEYVKEGLWSKTLKRFRSLILELKP